MDTTRLARNQIREATDILVSRSRGDSALNAFVLAVAPVESGGECRLTRPTPKVTTIAAHFPSYDSSQTRLTITFDSAGHLVRFIESRGRVPTSIILRADSTRIPPSDSVLRAAIISIPQSQIQLDFPLDEAVVMNLGNGRPTSAHTTIAGIEKFDKFGPPSKRILRVRKLCGV